LGSYGYANLEWRTKATTDTRFEIASMTKMFTGAAAKLLIESGKLSPTDPLTKYFPDAPATWSSMRVEHLIHMTHGLTDDWGTEALPYGAEFIGPTNNAQMLQAFYRQKLEAPVGDRFQYSSPAYTMLGMIVEKVSGQKLPDYIAHNIFRPSGMTQSGFIDNTAIVPNRADGYRMEGGQLKRGWILGQYLHARPCVGMLTTARDLANWIIALSGKRIVRDLDTLWQPTVSPSGKRVDYAYGWNIELLLGRPRIAHDGRFRTGFRSKIDWYPDEKVGVVVLSNLDSAEVDKIALLAARTVIRDLPDPEQEAVKRDPNPGATAKLVSALKAGTTGRFDPNVFEPIAFEPWPMDEVVQALKNVVRWEFAGRRELGKPVSFHGFHLRRYLTLRLVTKGGSHYLTFYYNDAGKIAYVEPTA
jgi:CubicO group peptidase (beta-lactamase class C family)